MSAVAAPDRAPDWVAGGTPEPLRSRLVAAVGAERGDDIYGFGANLGLGHLNVAGNRVYGGIFADVIARALPSQRQPGQ